MYIDLPTTIKKIKTYKHYMIISIKWLVGCVYSTSAFIYMGNIHHESSINRPEIPKGVRRNRMVQ